MSYLASKPGGGGSGAVNSVANSDGTLVISPTTGSVIASLNLAHANTWTALQTFNKQSLAATIVAAAALTNTTAATNAARVQNSPGLLFSGTNWTGSASQVISVVQVLKGSTTANRYSLSWDGTFGATTTPGLMVLNQAGDLQIIRNLIASTGSVQAALQIIGQTLVLNGTTSGSVNINAAATTTPYQVTLPSAQGAGALTNDGSGNLSWTPSVITLSTNGSLNGDQFNLNLMAGTNMVISDDGFGNITFDAASGSAPTFAQSLVNTSGTVTLVNDTASPGNNKYYGTNGSGVRGWLSSATVTGANAALSNLVSVAINSDLLSGATNTINLGSITNAFKTLSLPFGSGTATDPDLYWYDSLHTSKKGIRASGSSLFISIDNEDVAIFQDNGSTPFMVAGVLTGFNATVGAMEYSGLGGINDGGTNTYSNPNLTLKTNPANIPSGGSQGQFYWTQSAWATTNNTPTVIQTLIFGSNATISFEICVTARRTGGTSGSNGDSATFRLWATYKNVGGTLTLIDTVDKWSKQDNLNLDVNLVINSTTVEVQGTGDTNNNYQWHTMVVNQYVH